MIDRIGGHGANKTDVVHHGANLRKQLADLGAGLAKLFELSLWSETLERLALQLSQLLPLGHAFRHRLAVAFAKLWFVIKGLQMRRPPAIVSHITRWIRGA